MMSVTLDKKRLQREVFVQGEKIIKATLIPLIAKKIREEQQQMVELFEDHPVSQEIWAGNSADNSTGLLGGYGNLFSFIGFDEGSDPISPISFILRRKISFVLKRTNDHGGYVVTMGIPSKEELESVAKVGWLGGRSWLDGIENGLAGLNRYLYDEDYGFPQSLSGTAIQVKGSVRKGVSHKRTDYTSKILSDFRERLTRLL